VREERRPAGGAWARIRGGPRIWTMGIQNFTRAKICFDSLKSILVALVIYN
jgi:hypothetical protein